MAHLESCRAFIAVMVDWLAFIEEHTHFAEPAVFDYAVAPHFGFFDNFFHHYILIGMGVFKAMVGLEMKLGCFDKDRSDI